MNQKIQSLDKTSLYLLFEKKRKTLSKKNSFRDTFLKLLNKIAEKDNYPRRRPALTCPERHQSSEA